MLISTVSEICLAKYKNGYQMFQGHLIPGAAIFCPAMVFNNVKRISTQGVPFHGYLKVRVTWGRILLSCNGMQFFAKDENIEPRGAICKAGGWGKWMRHVCYAVDSNLGNRNYRASKGNKRTGTATA